MIDAVLRPILFGLAGREDVLGMASQRAGGCLVILRALDQAHRQTGRAVECA